MPSLNEAWGTICRFIARTNRSVTADSETGRTSNANGSNDAPGTVHAGSSRLHGFYARVKEQVLETQRQRNIELVMQEEIRKNRRAKRKALSLLMRLLNPEQRLEFRKFRHFHAIGGSSGNRYRIRVATFANIDVVGANGTVMYRLCAHPTGDVPVYDVMAAQLLHLQDPLTERRFLQWANVHLALSEDRLPSRSAWIA